jgi:hypothetical protein
MFFRRSNTEGGAQLLVVIRDAFRERQHQRDGMVGDLV